MSSDHVANSDPLKTLLVVDDDVAVRRVLHKALEHQGYRVLEASDGDEGLRIFEAHRDEITLVILDMLMPRMSGWDVLATLKQGPNPPAVILQTGFAGRTATPGAPAAEALLRKPYDLTDLVSTIRSVLDRREA